MRIAKENMVRLKEYMDEVFCDDKRVRIAKDNMVRLKEYIDEVCCDSKRGRGLGQSCFFHKFTYYYHGPTPNIGSHGHNGCHETSVKTKDLIIETTL